MRIGMVLGQVTLTRTYPTLRSGRFLVTQPIDRENLHRNSVPEDGETLVVYDELSAAGGCLIGFTEGREAGAPFGKILAPIDAYNSCILDDYTMTHGRGVQDKKG